MSAYPPLLRWLHWLMAVIIFAALALGVWSLYLKPGTPFRVELLTIHKSLGLTALALVVVRLLVRLATKANAYLPPLGRLNRLAAGVAHGLLYAMMLALPLSGYVHSMAGRHGFNWFGLIRVPNFVAASKPVDAGAGQAHYISAILIAALLTAHVLAALWHGYIRRDGVLARMWPGLGERRA